MLITAVVLTTSCSNNKSAEEIIPYQSFTIKKGDSEWLEPTAKPNSIKRMLVNGKETLVFPKGDLVETLTIIGFVKDSLIIREDIAGNMALYSVRIFEAIDETDIFCKVEKAEPFNKQDDGSVIEGTELYIRYAGLDICYFFLNYR